jgi:cephalosporin-C deacetylase-like acetyl esterase
MRQVVIAAAILCSLWTWVACDPTQPTEQPTETPGIISTEAVGGSAEASSERRPETQQERPQSIERTTEPAPSDTTPEPPVRQEPTTQTEPTSQPDAGSEPTQPDTIQPDTIRPDTTNTERTQSPEPSPDQASGGPCTAQHPTIAAQTPQTNQPLWAGPTKVIYKTGETIAFQVYSKQGGTVSYWIKEDERISTSLASGTIQLSAGQTKQVTVTLNHPGFVLLQATLSGQTVLAGAAVDPYCIQSLAKAPSDFDSFWNGQLTQLKGIALGTQRTDRGDKGTYRLYKVILNQLDGRKVYGWVTIPKQSGTYPAIFELPPFGSTSISPPSGMPFMEKTIYAKISIHNSDLEQHATNAYKPSNELDHTKNYFKYAILAGIRMIDYLHTLSSFDQKHLMLTGKSQGGGLSIMIAGLDSRVTHISSVVPAFGQHAAYRAGRSSGFPQWVYHKDKSGQTTQGDTMMKEAEYYELAHFAKRFKGIAHVMVGYIDTVCPPSSIVASANQLAGKTTFVHGPLQGHDWNAWGKNWWPIWNDYLKQTRQSW